MASQDWDTWARLTKNRKNIILEGAPGTGKTYAISKIIEQFSEINSNRAIGARATGDFGITMHLIFLSRVYALTCRCGLWRLQRNHSKQRSMNV